METNWNLIEALLDKLYKYSIQQDTLFVENYTQDLADALGFDLVKRQTP